MELDEEMELDEKTDLTTQGSLSVNEGALAETSKGIPSTRISSVSQTEVSAQSDNPACNDGTGPAGSQSNNGSAPNDPPSGSDNVSALGDHSRELIRAIQKLDALSIDASLTSLPKFVVVGDQSHGKSSLIEAVCDIALPRSEGTCTRCPMQITTTTSRDGDRTPWSCRIRLQRRYMYTSGKGAGQSYPHWQDTKSTTVVEFTTIDDKSSLERVLRLAQIAILNPEMRPEEILSANDLEINNTISFSPNVIMLEIRGSGLPELSFFDLPGAINMHEDHTKQYVVTVIEKLIKNYIKDEKALILLTIGANQDADNSIAYSFVYKSSALNRCMGVLTKPDLVPGNHSQIRRILNGEIFQLQNGWFVTRQLSQQEIDEGVPHSEARNREQAFFSTREPWCSSFAEFRGRFGTSNLRNALSRRLTEHIIAELPDILNRVQRRLDEVNEQLHAFPEQAKAPCLTVSHIIDRLTAAVVASIRGDDLDNNFRHSQRELLVELSDRLSSARPSISMGTPGFEPPHFEIDDDDEVVQEPSPTPVATPSKSRKGNNGRPISTPQRQSTQAPQTPRKSTTSPTKASTNENATLKLELDDLKLAYEHGSRSQLPDQLDPRVTESFILRSVSRWPEAVSMTLASENKLIHDMLSTVVEKTLAKRNQTKIYEQSQTVLRALAARLMESSKDQIQNVVLAETYKPNSVAKSFKDRKDLIKNEITEDRTQKRVNEHFDLIDAQSNKTTKYEERAKRANDRHWQKENLGPEPYSRELFGASIIFAYYDIASARMVDTIALLLQYSLLHGLEEHIRHALEDGLRVTDSDFCAELLAEDPHREALRRRLIAEQQKLLQAIENLRGLPMVASTQ